MAGDWGYSAPRIRAWPTRRRIEPVIPPRADELRGRQDRPALRFSRVRYRRRNTVERRIGWLKGASGVATRSDKLATDYLAMLTLAMIPRCLRLLDP